MNKGATSMKFGQQTLLEAAPYWGPKENVFKGRLNMIFKVKIDEAIKVLEKNAKEHDLELAEAIPAWTEKLKAAIDKYRDAVDRKALNASINDLWQLHNSRPVDNRNQYAKFLGGFRHSKEAGDLIVELDEYLYDQIFNDNWDWRQLSLASNSTYSQTAAAKLRR